MAELGPSRPMIQPLGRGVLLKLLAAAVSTVRINVSKAREMGGRGVRLRCGVKGRK